MSTNKIDTTNGEMSAWKKMREHRKRERRDHGRNDEHGDEDSFAALALTLDNDSNHNEYMGGLRESSDNHDNIEDEFVPIAKRKRLEEVALISGMTHRRRQIGINDIETGDKDTNNMGNSDILVTKKKNDDEDGNNNSDVDSNNIDNNVDPKKVESLLDSATALQETLTEEERAEKLRKEEETRIMKEASKVQTNALQAASELAKGIKYTNPMPATWTCPEYILKQGETVWEKIRKEWHMEVEGTDVPPPCKQFVDMKFAPPILEVLKRKGIKKPTPIQMQGLTVVSMYDDV